MAQFFGFLAGAVVKSQRVGWLEEVLRHREPHDSEANEAERFLLCHEFLPERRAVSEWEQSAPPPRRLFIMRPHAQHLYDAGPFEKLVHQTVLNTNAAGVCASKIADKLFKR